VLTRLRLAVWYGNGVTAMWPMHAVIDHLLSSKLHAILTRPNEKVCYKGYTSRILTPVVCITACPSLAVSNSSRLLTFSMDLFSYVRWSFFPPRWKFDGPIFRGLIFLVDVFTVAVFFPWTFLPWTFLPNTVQLFPGVNLQSMPQRVTCCKLSECWGFVDH